MEVRDAMRIRRMVRRFTNRSIAAADMEEILLCGILAPSGKNRQPWKFCVRTDARSKAGLSRLSPDNRQAIQQASHVVVVFLDERRGYDTAKDNQAIGACIENMLLAATAKGIGCCWIGGLNDKQQEVSDCLGLHNASLRLSAVIAFGYPDENPAERRISPLNVYILEGDHAER